MTTDQTVYQAISLILAPEASKRQSAESAIKQLQQTHPDFGLLALRISMSADIPVDHRQLASMVLKKYVDTHWTQKSENFVAPEPSDEIKAVIRQTILQALAEPVQKIQAAYAWIIARIAYFDWPEYWPSLFDSLLMMLKSEDAILVRGAMKVLSDFIHDDMTDQQFPQMAPVLLPELYKILASSKYSTTTRAETIIILRDCIHMLYTLKDDHPAEAKAMFSSLMSPWIDTFIQVLSSTSTSQDSSKDVLVISVEIYSTLINILQQFPSQLKERLPVLLESSLLFFHRIAQMYVNSEVNGEDDVLQGSAEEMMSLDSMMYVMFEFLARLAAQKLLKKSFVQSAVLHNLLHDMLCSVQITVDQEESWENDPNQFIADEDEFSVNLTVRSSADELLTTLLTNFGNQTITTLLDIVSQTMNSSREASSRGIANWWKPLEASLYVVGGIAEHIIEALQNNSIQFDLEGLFSHIIQHLLGCKDVPYIRGRALWFASRFGSVLPIETVQKYCEAAVIALKDASDPASVRVSAIKAIQNFCQLSNAAELSRYQGAMIEGAISLLPTVTEDTLLLLAETLCFAIQVNGDVTAHYAEPLAHLCIDLWKKHISDQLVCSVLNDIFEELSQNSGVYGPLVVTVLPVLLEVITSPEPLYETSDIRSSALDIVTSLINGGPAQTPPEVLQSVFPRIMQLALHPDLDEASILQSIQLFSKAIIGKNFEFLQTWHALPGNPVMQGKSGLEIMMVFLERLIDPRRTTESAALFTGDIVSRLISTGGKHIEPILPAMINAIVLRISESKLSSTMQSFITPLSHLCVNDATSVVSLLSSIHVHNTSGLEIVLKAWCDNFEYFTGYFGIKVNVVGMSRLASLLADQRLQQIVVKGDLIENPAEKNVIMTRSRRKQVKEEWTSVPFFTKAFKLLLIQYQDDLELKKHDISTSTYEDEEWEDDEDEKEMKYLHDLLDGDDFDDNVEDDSEDKQSPIYGLDIKSYLRDTFNQLATNFPQQFQQYGMSLGVEEQNILRDMLHQ